ncbi:FGGY-family carbohydrate kinase [Raineyella fluvialis]|uniref:Sugar kinase n=1 Tax=Raineyella fluvialis TaxID=2662261 RepID=A0A5Q2FCR5_9ACTN|nr:FGGY-family carbohydrate kinase [Raineyella fluvialis]QGF22883.1 sugar kinase [Raineyella fluvialis]
MCNGVVLGVDIGTSSTKAVALGLDGRILGTATRLHGVERDQPGQVSMDGEMWWAEFVDLCTELSLHAPEGFAAVGVSGMGPTLMLCDDEGHGVASAALYGVDSRSVEQIRQLEDLFGADEIYRTGDSYLSTQSVGPKFAWFRQHRPEAYASARTFHMPASLLVQRLTGEYVLDHQSAGQCTPLYDSGRLDWYPDRCELVAPGITFPRLAWAGDRAGEVTSAVAAGVPGLRAGAPVTVGSIDAWAEAYSVGATDVGDLMVMYGTTMCLVATQDHRVRHPMIWGSPGLEPGRWSLSGGMGTSGAITAWMRDLLGSSTYDSLTCDASASGPGARGLLMLPYFDGERTPILDPGARGTICGLTVRHTRGDLFRATLESVGYAVRHHLEAFREAGVGPDRAVAVGGGVRSSLSAQLVSDITGLPQQITRVTIGASYGDAHLAARLVTDVPAVAEWNPVVRIIEPCPEPAYEELYGLYRQLYEATSGIQHALAAYGPGTRKGPKTCRSPALWMSVDGPRCPPPGNLRNARRSRWTWPAPRPADGSRSARCRRGTSWGSRCGPAWGSPSRTLPDPTSPGHAKGASPVNRFVPL